MTDLASFLRTRYEELRAIAEAASPGPWHTNAESDEVLAADGITVADGFALSGNQLRATTEHIAANDPEDVLADLVAKLAIVQLHEPERQPGLTSDIGDRDTWILCCSACRLRVHEEYDDALEGQWPCPTLRHLAASFAAHPDYRPEWAPGG